MQRSDHLHNAPKNSRLGQHRTVRERIQRGLTSNIMVISGDILIISPELRQS